MIEHLTADELAELHRLAQAATPGPWAVYERSCPLNDLGRSQGFTADAEPQRLIGTADAHPQLEAPAPVVGTAYGPFHEPPTRVWISAADAAFIAASRAAVPRLLNELARVQYQRDRAHAAIRALLIAHDSGRGMREELAALRELVGNY